MGSASLTAFPHFGERAPLPGRRPEAEKAAPGARRGVRGVPSASAGCARRLKRRPRTPGAARARRWPRGAEAAAAKQPGGEGRRRRAGRPRRRAGRAEKGAACAGCGELAAKLKKAEKRINSRDGYNKPDAERHSADRAEFRREHGAHDGDRKPRKKMGPPVGHKGVSHSRKSEETRYARLSACEYCGLAEHLSERPRNKMRVKLDGAGKIRASRISAGRAWCARCCRIGTAESESIPGTRTRIGLPGSAVACIAKAMPCASVAELVEEEHGCGFAQTAAINARDAAANLLEPGGRRAAERIKDSDGCGQADETPFNMRGKRGYARVVCCWDAVRAGFPGSRAAAAAGPYFPEVKGKPMVTGGHAGYSGIGARQTCPTRLLRHAESFAIRAADAEDRELRLRLRYAYRKISRIDTADEAAVRELERRVLEIAGGRGGERAMRAALAGALPRMLAFPRHPGMPCHNNRTEQATRGGPAGEKRSRRRPGSAAGMRRLSITCTVFQARGRLGIWPSAALKALRADPEWDVFAHPAAGPPRAPAAAAA